MNPVSLGALYMEESSSLLESPRDWTRDRARKAAASSLLDSEVELVRALGILELGRASKRDLVFN